MRIKKFNENWVDADPKEIAVENTLWNEVINFIQSSKSDINNEKITKELKNKFELRKRSQNWKDYI